MMLQAICFGIYQCWDLFLHLHDDVIWKTGMNLFFLPIDSSPFIIILLTSGWPGSFSCNHKIMLFAMYCHNQSLLRISWFYSLLTLTVLHFPSCRGGLRCKIWNAILNHRQTSGKTSGQVNALEEHKMGISKWNTFPALKFLGVYIYMYSGLAGFAQLCSLFDHQCHTQWIVRVLCQLMHFSYLWQD